VSYEAGRFIPAGFTGVLPFDWAKPGNSKMTRFFTRTDRVKERNLPTLQVASCTDLQ
jgi:hypothetical protein